MFDFYSIAAVWMGLAGISVLIARRLKISVALVEILIGVLAAMIAERLGGLELLGAKLPWVTFLAGTGAVMLTFLAGAELDPVALRKSWKEVIVVGLISFAAPFLGCAAIARWLLEWSPEASWLAGVALSTTSMAVVYAVMLETGLNKTSFGKAILGACFVTDLGTVIALGLLFAPFNIKTLIFAGVSALAFVALPFVTPKIIEPLKTHTGEFQTKWILFFLFALGSLAAWAGSEAVLPAYIAGMVLASYIGADHFYLARLRTLTIGLLTPFYFIRAGSYVSIPAIVAAPLVFSALFGGKVFSKIFGLLPIVRFFHKNAKEVWYYTLLMSTGLTFGSISAMYGLTNGIISQEQYSHLVAVVIGSAVIPTIIANAVFLPLHLIKGKTVFSGSGDASSESGESGEPETA